MTILLYNRRTLLQFCLDQHDMTDTTKLSTQEMQDQVVNQLQRSIEVPGKVLMLLVSFSFRLHH